MALSLIFLFLCIPLIEIAFFIEIGGFLGLWPVIFLTLATALAGATLVRVQGFGIVRRIQATVAHGKIPVHEAVEGLCLFAAGAALLTPGFFTDIIGFLLLVPPFRRWFAARLMRRLLINIQPPSANIRPDGDIIEGEYWEVNGDEDTPPAQLPGRSTRPRTPSPWAQDKNRKP